MRSRISSITLRSLTSDVILSSSRLNTCRSISTSSFIAANDSSDSSFSSSSSSSSFSTQQDDSSSSSGQNQYRARARKPSLSSRFPQEQIVFVGNLPETTTRDSIINAMSSVGGIAEVDLITDNYSGQPRGFGFVAFESVEKAQSAVDTGSFDINGTQVSVKTSKSRDDISLGGRKLFVGNVPYQTTKEQLEQELSKFGALDDIHIPANVDGRPKGYAFIVFKNKEDAQKALNQREVEVNSRILRCEPFVNVKRTARFGEGGGSSGGYGQRREGGFSGGYGGSSSGGYGQRREGGSSYGQREGGSSSGGYGQRREGGSGYSSGGYGQRREGGSSYGQRDGSSSGGYGQRREGGSSYGNRRSSSTSDHSEQPKEGNF